MSESTGRSSGSSEEDAREAGGSAGKAGRDTRKAGAGVQKANVPKAGANVRKAGANARKAAVSTTKIAAGARKATASMRPPAQESGKSKQQVSPKIVPMYARLPRGPHPLSAPGVAHNQRIRIHGGMIEAVTTRGYPQTSVKLVVGLAGVSRRSFYEQFSGKEECFMATFDLIVNRAIKRLTDAYRAADGDQQQRLRAVLQALGAELEQNPKALRLAIADSQTAGAEGVRRLQKTTAIYEGLLAGALSGRCPPTDGAKPAANKGAAAGAAGRDGCEALPPPVVRAIVGGLRRATQMRLLDEDTEDLQPLVREMGKWLLLFQSPALARLRPGPCADRPFPQALQLEPDACGGESRRARVLRSAIETGLCERKLADLSSPRIAEGAELPFEAVMELYPDPQACYLEALDVLGDELLQLIAGAEQVAAPWPASVCRTIDALLAHLASSPARLMTLAVRAPEAGPAAIASVRDLAYEVATLLTEGSPRRPRTRIAVEGIAGGLWNILYCEAIAGRGHRLPLLSEHISYVVLTPYLGPEAAVRAIVASRAAATPRGEEDEDYRRLAERRSAKCVNTTPTSAESTITTIKGA
jgi:AcrR family transcriptional regulator